MSMMSYAKTGIALLTGAVASGCGGPKPLPEQAVGGGMVAPAVPKMDFTGLSTNMSERAFQIGARLNAWQFEIEPRLGNGDHFRSPLPGSPGTTGLRDLLRKDLEFLDKAFGEGKRFGYENGFELTNLIGAIETTLDKYDESLKLPRAQQIDALRYSYYGASRGASAALHLSEIAKGK